MISPPLFQNLHNIWIRILPIRHSYLIAELGKELSFLFDRQFGDLGIALSNHEPSYAEAEKLAMSDILYLRRRLIPVFRLRTMPAIRAPGSVSSRRAVYL